MNLPAASNTTKQSTSPGGASDNEPVTATHEVRSADLRAAINAKDLQVPVARQGAQSSHDDAEALRAECVALARSARDCFKEACELSDEDLAEASFFSARDKIRSLWKFSDFRNEAFQGLLALLDAALSGADLHDMNASQRDAIRVAFADLPEWFLQQSAVDVHIRAFAEQRIDVLKPVRSLPGKRLRVIIEECEGTN